MAKISSDGDYSESSIGLWIDAFDIVNKPEMRSSHICDNRMDAKIEAALEKYDAQDFPTSIPESLALLDFFAAKHATNTSFAGYDCIFIQHHLGSLVPKVKAITDCGLNIDRSWFVDIPYSTSRAVVDALIANGADVRQMSTEFSDPFSDYAHAQSARVAFMLHKIIERPQPRPLLVIDDGAYFLRFVKDVERHAPELMKHFRGSRVVEQTTRGHRFIEEQCTQLAQDANLSIVSIARSKTKTEFEGPFISVNVVNAILRAVGKSQFAKAKKLAMIGYGTVGGPIVSMISKQFPQVEIHVVERAWSQQMKNELPRINCKPLEALQRDGGYDIVVGCTGTHSFLLEERHLLSYDAVLASASSGDVEFDRFGFVELADRLPNDEIEVLGREEARKQGIHATISIRHEGGKVMRILNAGFPCNFNGIGLETIPYNIIQATHTLLFAAALQATQSTRSGLQTIPEKVDEQLFAHAVDRLVV
jgi:hypothetical protein